jgi:hypothetical protein
MLNVGGCPAEAGLTEGAADLADRSSRPHHSPRMDQLHREESLALRCQRLTSPGHCPVAEPYCLHRGRRAASRQPG